MEKLIRLRRSVFKEFLKKKSLLRKNVVERADIVESTLTYAFTKGCSRETIDKIEKALELASEECNRLEQPVEDGRQQANATFQYSWADVLRGAALVRKQIFEARHPDAILTFPGPASIFTGLVLEPIQPRKASLRIPIYTAILVDKESPNVPGFEAIATQRFKILVPLALIRDVLDHHKKVVVVDDTIITGVTMEELRRNFGGRGYDISFACCVCYEGRTLASEVPPEIFAEIAAAPEFRMPWGDAFCNEDCFPPIDENRAKQAASGGLSSGS